MPRYSGTANSTGRANRPNQIAETTIVDADGQTVFVRNAEQPTSGWMKPKYTISSSTMPPM